MDPLWQSDPELQEIVRCDRKIREFCERFGIGYRILLPFIRKEERREAKEAQARARIDNFPISPAGLYGYLRVSSPPQITGTGLDRQRQTITEYAVRKDFDANAIVFFEDVASTFHEQHINKNFGLFLTIMRLRRLGPNPHLFFESTDRFTRSTSNLMLNVEAELNENNITMHFVHEDEFIPGNIPGYREQIKAYRRLYRRIKLARAFPGVDRT